MKNSKLRRILLTLACAVLLVSLSVGATLAYLTSTTDVVTNTFTVGNVKITLDEADVTVLGVKETENRVTENDYHLLPAHSYIKDPTVHIDDESEDCWLFVKVTNDIADIEDATTIADQMKVLGWTKVDGETNVYAYKEIVSAGEDVVVFNSFKIKGTVTKEELAAYDEKTITVQAYAVQADGLASAAAAWTAAPCTWGDAN